MESTQTKVCSKCKTEKPLEEFHKNRSKKDGLNCWCKGCLNTCNTVRRRTREGKAKQKEYDQSEKGRSAHKVADKRNRDKYPEKVKARCAVKSAVRAGRLLPVKDLCCVYCGREAVFYHHWHGYKEQQWLNVVPACHKCDRAEHTKIIKIDGALTVEAMKKLVKGS